jgi:hypothetical protein
MNIIYSIIMLALVGLALTAQTAFATANGTLVVTSSPTNCYKASNGVNTCVSGIGCASPNCSTRKCESSTQYGKH